MPVLRLVTCAWCLAALAVTVRLAFSRTPLDENQALESNPRLTSARISRALFLERERKFASAEADLLQAARFDRQYAPAWTLANFYFRRGNAPSFWTWARRAAALNYDDLRPLLRLAHELEPSPTAALDRLGGGDRLTRADLDYLIAREHYDDAQQIARRLPNDAPRLIETADRQIRSGHAAYALELWNAVRPPLDPAHGAILSNGTLPEKPTGAAFDWRIASQPGVDSTWQPGEITFAFSGSQPEACSLLEQTVPVLGDRGYRLTFESRGDARGLSWDFSNQQSPQLEGAPSWRTTQSVFRAQAPGLTLARLRLIYRRMPGSVRAPGRIELRNLQMTSLSKDSP